MKSKKQDAAIVGLGVAACAVCCAGPIIGFLAALSVGALVATAAFGLVGLALAIAGGLWLYRRRRRRIAACAPEAQPVSISSKRLSSPSR